MVEEEPAQGATGTFQEVTLSELLENPAAFVGRQVTVSGRVTETDVDGESARPAAFTLGEGVDEDVLVLPTAQAQIPTDAITDDSVLRVQGTVREVGDTLAEEDEFLYEEEPAEDAFLADFTDQVAIAATQVDTNIPRGDASGEEEPADGESI